LACRVQGTALPLAASNAVIPIGDENHTVRFPVVTVLLLACLAAVWIFVQGAGADPTVLAASVCNLGLVAGELTGRATVGEAVPLGHGLACIVDRESVNVLTPLSSMFLHGGWGHLLGNALFLWVFGNNVEDSMGRLRFVLFYLVCGIAAALGQIAIDPSSPVPMVGASGAISGVLGGYLLLYPRVHVRVLFIIFIFIRVIRIPAYMVLLWWIGYQVLLGLPQLTQMEAELSWKPSFQGASQCGPTSEGSWRERRWSSCSPVVTTSSSIER
jgi:membrane associated rhomboid family serine protease